MLPTKKQRVAEMGNFSDYVCCTDTSLTTGKSVYVDERMTYSRNGSSLLSSYRASFASVSAITASQSFSSIVDNDDDDDALILEQARKDVTAISPVMLKYSRSSSMRIYSDDMDTEEPISPRKSIINMTPKSKETPSATTKQRHVSGPRYGTLENDSQENHSVELNKTYIQFRMDEDIARVLMSKVTCSVPPFHTTHLNYHTHPIADVCSEPLASNFHVRGPTYLQDGEKIPSQHAIFALLGCDSILRPKNGNNEPKMNISSRPDSFVGRFQKACHELGFRAPFILVINFVVPWGNLMTYHFRPDGSPDGQPYPINEYEQTPADRLLVNFLSRADDHYRNTVLKFIPSLYMGPWILKRLVGSAPCLIGQKLPTSYYGCLEERYLEIVFDITKGSAVVNSICSSVASKSTIVTVDLAFLLEGTEERTLPEQLLTTVRLHHISI